MYKIRRHAETHLGMKLPCNMCDKVCGTRNALSIHYARVHGDQVQSSWSMKWLWMKKEKNVMNRNNKSYSLCWTSNEMCACRRRLIGSHLEGRYLVEVFLQVWSEIWCSVHSGPECTCGWDDIARTEWEVSLPQLWQELSGKTSSSKTRRDPPEHDPSLYCLSENLQDTECPCNPLHKTTSWRSCITMDHEVKLINSVLKRKLV